MFQRDLAQRPGEKGKLFNRKGIGVQIPFSKESREWRFKKRYTASFLRLDVPLASLGAFQLDASQEPEVVRVHCEGVTFDPQDFLSSFQRFQ